MKQIAFSRDALKILTRIPGNTAKLIRSKIDQYARDPKALANNVKTLKGQPGVKRLRIGDWRVLFREEAATIVIIRIAARGSAYD